MNHLDWAMAYASMGLSVFPCLENSKSPLTSRGFLDATTDGDRISSWWSTRPYANIGIAIPNDELVLDVDKMHSSEGLDISRLPPTPFTITPRENGGRHYWFKKPIDVPVRPTVNIMPGVDVRSVGSYVIAPPSIHPNGKVYEWGISRIAMQPADVPDWVLDFVKSGEIGEDHSKPEDALLGIKEGGRQTALFRLACRLRRLGTSEEEALAVLQTAADRATPPYRERSMTDLVRRVWKRWPAGNNPAHERKGWRLSDLVATKLEQPKWYINKMLPEGLTLFFSDPKLGKSMLISNLMISVARGEFALDRYKAHQAGVLVLDLEQGETFAQERWLRILGNRPAPDNLHVFFEWAKMDQGGLDEIKKFLDIHTDIGVVAIDVLSKFWPVAEPPGLTAYHKDYHVMSKLARLAHDYKIALIAVHHRSKAEGRDFLSDASGSMGMTAAADVVWALSRERDHPSAVLKVTGKNVPDSTIIMDIKEDGFVWTTHGPSPNQTSLITDLAGEANHLQPGDEGNISGLAGL